MAEYNNIWDALFDNKEESENLRIRSELMLEIAKYIKEKGLTQIQAADEFGVSQPRMSNLVNGKIDKFTIDMLVNFLTKIGVRVDLNVSKSQEKNNIANQWKNLVFIEDWKERRSTKRKDADWDVDLEKPQEIASIG